MKKVRAIVMVGSALLIFAVLTSRAFPRYEWRDSKRYKDVLIRVDRWTGQAQIGVVDAQWGRWVSLRERRADARAKADAAREQTNRQIDDLLREIDATLANSAPAAPTAPRRAGALLLAWGVGIGCGWLVRRRVDLRRRRRTSAPTEPV